MGLPPVNKESIWRQVIIVYRGGILADWCVLGASFYLKLCPHLFVQANCAMDFHLFSEQDDKETLVCPWARCFNLLETNVIPCLGSDRIPDYLVTQLAKFL